MVGECAAPGSESERRNGLRQAKVQHLYRAVVAHLDVRGFEVAMNDAVLVSGGKRVGDLPRDRQRFVDRQRPAAMRSASVGPSTSSYQRWPASVASIHRSTRCSMIQRCQQLRFALETRDAPRSAAKLSGRTLVRPRDVNECRSPDRPDPSLPSRSATDFVRAQPGTRRQCRDGADRRHNQDQKRTRRRS